MANLDFPQNPALGQEYKGPKGKSYWWDGVKWSIKRPIIVHKVPSQNLRSSRSQPPNLLLLRR
jgi:hypothetical protein